MTLAAIAAALAPEGLAALGAFHPDPADGAPAGTGTLVLVGPRQPGFWPRFAASPEAADTRPDPLDRWTIRVLTDLAAGLGARALFPFGGQPYLPFIAWALRTGRIWTSPVGLLVHARAGLFVSLRGALALPGRLALPPPATRPCDACPAPCLGACPVAALGADHYDVPACRAWIAAPSGADCLAAGCAVRRACPVGRNERPPAAQAGFHMAAFRGRQDACDA